MDALLDLQTLETQTDSIDMRASGISIACGDGDPNSNLSWLCGDNHLSAIHGPRKGSMESLHPLEF